MPAAFPYLRSSLQCPQQLVQKLGALELLLTSGLSPMTYKGFAMPFKSNIKLTAVTTA